MVILKVRMPRLKASEVCTLRLHIFPFQEGPARHRAAGGPVPRPRHLRCPRCHHFWNVRMSWVSAAVQAPAHPHVHSTIRMPSWWSCMCLADGNSPTCTWGPLCAVCAGWLCQPCGCMCWRHGTIS